MPGQAPYNHKKENQAQTQRAKEEKKDPHWEGADQNCKWRGSQY